MKRRYFLTGLGAGASGILLTRCTHWTAMLKDRSLRDIEPQHFISQDGLLEVDLIAVPSVYPIGRHQAQLLTYNGQAPGPILEARAGDTMRVHFTNQLTQSTNLHFHGLHIPPTGTGDNVFLEVPPGETWTYEFALPRNHPAGLAWYHPHYHGLVAEQVYSGLAGPILIRGDLDEVPEVKAADETLIVLKDFGLTRSGQVATPNALFKRWGREGDLLTVNGQLRPSYGLTAGQLKRLRILNAATSKIFRLALDDHALQIIATDGGALQKPIKVDELVLAPGERVDVLVQANQKPGTYPLLSLPYDRGIAKMMDKPLETSVLADFTYDGAAEAEPMPLPEILIPVAPLSAPSTIRELVLDHGIAPGSGAPFLINGKAFDHGRIDTQVKLGTVEDWVLVNKASMDHPFHLHTNAFQVIERNGEPVVDLVWKDTVNLEAYETVKIRVKFSDYAGKTVYHCHILDHEDQGMMGIIEMRA
ncbi:MAG: multicopper oxidase family protein [Cyanobacteria bacterium P01_D01_bin.44]